MFPDPLKDLSRSEMVMLFAIGTVELTLMPSGLVDGPRRLTPQGKAAYDALVASGFQPTPDEMRLAAQVLFGSPGE